MSKTKFGVCYELKKTQSTNSLIRCTLVLTVVHALSLDLSGDMQSMQSIDEMEMTIS